MTTTNAQLENQIRQTIKRVPVSPVSNLIGFKMDIDAYLEQQAIFRQVRVKRTGDPACALLATCCVADQTVSGEDIAQVLERVWQHDLRYAHWEAHQITVAEMHVELRFITTSGESAHDLCVTGKIIVSRHTS